MTAHNDAAIALRTASSPTTQPALMLQNDGDAVLAPLQPALPPLPPMNTVVETRVCKVNASALAFPDGILSDAVECADPESERALEEGARLLRDGALVAMPTETVYGLAANALDADAVRSVFRAKGRPGDNPLIVHVSSLQMLAKVVSMWTGPEDVASTAASEKEDELDRALAPLHLPASMRLVIRRHWPGPLTLLLPRHPSIPDAVTCGRPTVGVRLPAHPVARALIARAGLPLAAPSANTSGRPSPTRAMHVYDDLNGRIPLILDAGACQVGVESTVLDCLRRPPAILRPGGVTDADLRQLGHPTFEHVLLYKRDFTDGQLEAAPTTPGMKYRHYSPRAPVILFELHPPVNAASDQSITLETETIQRQALRARLLAEADRLHRKTGDASHLVGVLTVDAPTVPSNKTAETATDTLEDADTLTTEPGWPDYIRRWQLGPWTRPDVVARRLFDGLRLLDVQPGVRWILVEGVADQGAGVAVMNRLRKAAASVIYL